MRFGAHTSTSGGLHKALQRALLIGGDICQIFVKNNMQWFGKPYLAAAVSQYADQLSQCNVRPVFGHSGYLINLASAPGANRDKSIQSLIQEIELAAQLDLPFLVLHPGAHLGAGEAQGLAQVVAGLDEVVRSTRTARVRIALENTAGQGSCLGCEVKHLAEIFQRARHPERLGLCLDTAHFFAAGYDIRTPKGWNAAIGEVEQWIGLDQILAFHLNDSKTDLGSRVDRHAQIGQGKIGLEGFRGIVNDTRFRDHPGCLETPKSDDLHEDIENLRLLRSLIAAPSGPRRGQAPIVRPNDGPARSARRRGRKPLSRNPSQRRKSR